MASTRFDLSPDKQGMVWDLLMYVPTVTGLGAGCAIFWHSGNLGLAYLLLFLASFFFYQGLHRILQRLMLLKSAPVALEIGRHGVTLHLKGGARQELVKNVRYFSDYAGKSFGLTGLDLAGAKRQYVFHKGQFGGNVQFQTAGAALKVFG